MESVVPEAYALVNGTTAPRTEAIILHSRAGVCLSGARFDLMRGFGGFMRVLLEYKNKRVDIKTPISMRQKIDEKPELLARLIDEALTAVGGKK